MGVGYTYITHLRGQGDSLRVNIYNFLQGGHGVNIPVRVDRAQNSDQIFADVFLYKRIPVVSVMEKDEKILITVASHDEKRVDEVVKDLTSKFKGLESKKHTSFK